MSICIFPGSFDPPTVGHVDIIVRAARLFDRVIVAVMDNGLKRSVFSPEERANMLTICVGGMKGVEVITDGGLLVEVARRLHADVVVRGLRGEADVSAEGQMAMVNHHLTGIETVFLLSRPEHMFISSTMVREVARHGGSIQGMAPEAIRKAIEDRLAQ